MVGVKKVQSQCGPMLSNSEVGSGVVHHESQSSRDLCLTPISLQPHTLHSLLHASPSTQFSNHPSPITIIVIVKYLNVYLTSSVLFGNANFSYFHPRVLVSKRYLVFFIKQLFYIKGLGAIPRGNERLFQKLLYFLKFVLKSPI